MNQQHREALKNEAGRSQVHLKRQHQQWQIVQTLMHRLTSQRFQVKPQTTRNHQDLQEFPNLEP